MASRKRSVPATIRFLRHLRAICHELHKTLEHFFPVADMFIVRALLVYLLLEKAWRLTR